MGDQINGKINAASLQPVEIEDDPGGPTQTEAGTMTYMDEDFQMQASAGGDALSRR